MTSTEMLSTYEALSELTTTMLAAARRGEWDQLATLEEHCRGHVSSLMQAKPVTLNETEQRAKIAIIRAILQNDAKIRSFTEPHMHQLQERISMARTSQRGVRAYGSQHL